MAQDVRDNRLGRPAMAVGVVILIAAAVGIPIWLMKYQHTGTAPATDAAAARGSAAGAPSSVATPAPAESGKSGGRPRGTGARGRAGEAAAPVTHVDADAAAGARIATPPPEEAASDKPPSKPMPILIVKPIYDASDTDVTAPRLLTPLAYAPLPEGAPPEAANVAVQILVNDDGTVDSVKATVSPKTIGESILMTSGLSIAKAWRFDPAVKDGHPVRYTLVVPLSRMFRD